MKMPPNSILMIEGIHCLNEKLTPLIKRNEKFKIFIAPLTCLNMDEMNFISNTTNRLIRRMVRDYSCRGYNAIQTLDRWPSVVRSEQLYIFPYMKEAGKYSFIINNNQNRCNVQQRFGL